ncbi:YiiX/YebB-like N1pC/P60 family cysteine hydrolase [Haloferula sp.]|uniref:YiiX/YebB-like N1pC/P60 family cysteine hydrolase n=1 Tax=Haloferula sp. TaxID=2497595 RepID=UPI00329E19B0
MDTVTRIPDPSSPVDLDPADPRVLRAATAIMGVTTPETLAATSEIAAIVDKSRDRGYFLPDEDDAIRVRYSRFLGARSVLLATLESMEAVSGGRKSEWERRLPAFAVALAATCQIVRGSRDWIALAETSRILRKKLDEADARHGVPRKTFARLYRSGTNTTRKLHFQHAVDFYRSHRSEFEPLRANSQLAEILEMIDEEVSGFDLRSSQVWIERFRYRCFSFRRRHHSAWKNTIFEVFRWSGSLIADLRQPGVKATNEPKRVTAELREQALKLAKPGDIFVTRHDDAMSNLFLPGFWPHAALYLGSEAARAEMGLEFPPPHQGNAADPVCFLESKKDGVRLRSAEDTLEVDAFMILRPPLPASEICEALTRAIGHSGKLYDFVFDFRCSDRLACTELVYRAYHQCGPLEFSLCEAGGRMCLPAEELINQSLSQGFKVVASCGLGSGGILKGLKAELAVHNTRAGI